MMNKLLAYGANPNTQDNNGDTLLHYLCEHNGESHAKLLLINYLLSEGANPNIQNKQGETPLHDAAFALNPHIVRLLLKHEADIKIRNENGNTPIHKIAEWEEFGLFKNEIEKTTEVFEQYLAKDVGLKA